MWNRARLLVSKSKTFSFICHSDRGGNLENFLYTEPLWKRDLLQKARNCSKRSKFFPFRTNFWSSYISRNSFILHYHAFINSRSLKIIDVFFFPSYAFICRRFWNKLPSQLIIKYFLQSFSHVHWFKKGWCQLLAKYVHLVPIHSLGILSLPRNSGTGLTWPLTVLKLKPDLNCVSLNCHSVSYSQSGQLQSAVDGLFMGLMFSTPQL